jgi:phenylacetate-CoA ligase
MEHDIYRYRDIACWEPAKIRRIQEKLFKAHLAYCLEKSPYYKKLSGKTSVIKKYGLETLKHLPFTDKADLEKNNDRFLAARPQEIVDIVFSSGTTGLPTRMMYTECDLIRLAYNEERSFAACGLKPNDRVLLTCTMDRCFVAGLAYFLGIRALGAAAIRNGLAGLESHARIISQIKPTAIVGVPSFLRKLGAYIRRNGSASSLAGVKRLICIGEPLRNRDMAALGVTCDIEELWAAKAFSTYASTECVSTFCECSKQAGGHLHPDLAIVEIVDEKGNVLSPGAVGEVVITALGIRGMPFIRFKTGDESFIIDEPCACGRNTLRLGPIIGRKKQMLKLKGTTLYPQAVYAALDEIPGVSEYYIEAGVVDDFSDSLTVYLATNDLSLTSAIVQEKLQSCLRVKPEVVIRDEETIKAKVYNSGSRKPVRFFDGRNRTCLTAVK